MKNYEKHCMDRFCECKYSFKLTFLWRKLYFYTRAHEKYASFVALSIIKSEKLIGDHITIVFALCAQHGTLLSNVLTKQYFFLNSNPEMLCKLRKQREERCEQQKNDIDGNLKGT